MLTTSVERTDEQNSPTATRRGKRRLRKPKEFTSDEDAQESTDYNSDGSPKKSKPIVYKKKGVVSAQQNFELRSNASQLLGALSVQQNFQGRSNTSQSLSLSNLTPECKSILSYNTLVFLFTFYFLSSCLH